MAAGTGKSRIDLAFERNFTLGGLEIRPATREVIVGEAREFLEPRVMQVLVAFARQRGEVVLRDDLTDTCWDGRVVSDDAVNRCVAAIRKLAATHGGFTLETIPRLGHRLLEIPLEALPGVEIEAGEPPAVADSPVATAIIARHWRWLAGGLALVLLAALAVMIWPHRRPDETLLVRTPSRLSIAVLPFTPLYSDPDAQNLGDSIATSVADMLSSGTRFVIVSPARSFNFRGPAKAHAAQSLQADFLIDGEIRRNASAIEVAVRIIDGRDGTMVRSATLSRSVDQVDTLPGDVATRVAGFGWISANGFSSAARWDRRVMAAQLRALQKILGSGDFAATYEITRQAAAEAPDDAFAQHIHGNAIVYLLGRVPPERKPALLAELRRVEERAIKLDPGYGDPYSMLQSVEPMSWADRERLLRRSLSLVPESTYSQVIMIQFLHNAGRFRDAEPVIEHALLRAPYQDSLNMRAINSRVWLGRAAEARPLIPRTIRMLISNSMYFARMFEATAFNGDLASADALLRDTDARQVYYPEEPPALYGLVMKALRQRNPANIAAMSKFCERVGDQPQDIKLVCLVGLTVFGRTDEAYRIADEVYPDLRGATSEERRNRWLAAYFFPTAYLFVPASAPLRIDPRFRDVIERTGLLAYWKEAHIVPDFCAAEKVPVCAELARAR